jgi:hypothetical protein
MMDDEVLVVTTRTPREPKGKLSKPSKLFVKLAAG